jgi:hypothetical protein
LQARSLIGVFAEDKHSHWLKDQPNQLVISG